MSVATFILVDDYRRRMALDAVRKSRLGMQVRISNPTRNKDQNAHMHSLLTQISDQISWPLDTGEVQTVDWWKRRTTLQWLLEEAEGDPRDRPEVVTPLYTTPGEEPTFAILLPHTGDLSEPQAAAYIAWLYSFGVKHGVTFKEKKEQPEPPPEAYEDQR